MEKRRRSLILLYPTNRLLPAISLPVGFTIRNFKDEDNEQYLKLLHSEGWTLDEEQFKNFYNSILPNGLFLIEDESNGSIISTATALHNPNCSHHYFPFGGEIGFVITLSDYRSKGLGAYVTAAATRRLLNAGYNSIRAVTHDHRLAAIKTYLKLGFLPFLYDDDMDARWNKIYDELGLTYHLEDCIKA